MDNRQDLLIKLSHYQPIDDHDRLQARRIELFVKQFPNCFDRSLTVGHITGSAWLVDKTGTKVLLTHHKKLNKWLQLGGHADGNPAVLQAALREATEESGIKDIRPLSEEIFDVDVHLIPAFGGEPEHGHYDIRFAFQVFGDQAPVVSDESHELQWVNIDDMERFTRERSMMRMAQKWTKMQTPR